MASLLLRSSLRGVSRSGLRSSRCSLSAWRMISSKALVEDAIAQNDIVIFSKSYCPFCKKAKDLIHSQPTVAQNLKKLQIFELDQREDGSDIQAYLLEKSGQRTVPNIYIHQNHVGGSDDLAKAHKSGELQKLLA